ncbi:tRNA (adenosine(37)-N6)-threonylcarbamoyltransferase complex dimerization subunit type 1 TsaB [Zavarzinia compransoris]|uniref:tRNA (adenosine(37)-N6)-threonylcarbamoyltransferase complex dimerization subunit type 1 TsaB n=1 Tax=Zavarzinia marina TaxID=2911065 RepID=UPI001F32C4CE|nr:tRNA (adenosine(37)-N6)-threonylcarbamoyltransferase complex dimerization subunit type 1 TsaB [Zavarzinia marina]MCF4165430.1 tRNA (adenosine(37)-N6)-threonylcarbamoyltransferase complex dimerization subunit type 1 TsaB [Zavarzinia marina]
MNVLAFDCATGPTSVAVRRDGTLAARAEDARPQGQAESLVPLIETTLAKADLPPAAIDRIAVTLGPGSFTGVRIAVAAARGLALAVGCPIFGFSSLEAMAAALPAADVPTLIAIDARRGEIYAQTFAPDGNAMDEARALPLEAVAAALPAGPLRLAGSGAGLVADRLAAAGHPPPRMIDAAPAPDAAVLARLAETAPAARGTAAPAPIYLRPPDAKPPAA